MTVRSLNQFLALFFATLILVACSGDNNNGLQISGTTPSSGELGVEPDNLITVTFDQTISAASVTDNSLTVEGTEGRVSGAVTFDELNNTIIFKPDRKLGLMRDYVVTIDEGLTDISDNNMTTDYSWSFSTRDGAWQTTESIKIGDGFYEYDIAIDDLGNSSIVWSENTTSYNMFSKRFDIGSGWGPNVPLDMSVGVEPKVAFDAAGNAICVWIEFVDTNPFDRIVVSYYSPVSGWSSAQVIEEISSYIVNLDLVMNKNGQAIMTWFDYTSTSLKLQSKHYDPDNGWGVSLSIHNSDNGAFDFNIAINDEGEALAVWSENEGAHEWSRVSNYSPSSGWATPVLIVDDDMNDIIWPAVVTDGSGGFFTIWEEISPFHRKLLFRQFNKESGWGTVETVVEGELVSYPRLAFSDSGDVLVAWVQQNVFGIDSIWVKNYSLSYGWNSPIMIATDSIITEGLNIAMDQAGNALAVWSQVELDYTNSKIWANRFIKNQGWGSPGLIQKIEAESAGFPEIVMNPAGIASAVWLQHDGTSNNIWLNRYE